MAQMPQASVDERSLDAVPNAPDRHKPVGFILRLAKALHTYGVPAYELETTLSACARQLGYGLQCLSLPTSITMSLMRKKDHVQTFVIRVAPGEVHLEKLRRVSDVAHRVMKGELSTADGADELQQINKARPAYPMWVVVIAFAMVSASVARLFGGGLNEMIGATSAGLALGLLTIVSARVSLLAHLLPATAALLSTLVAYATAHFLPGTEVYISVVSGLIILLPGLTLTIAMAELATQNLMSGTARLFGAGTVFILMAFGMVIGNHIADVFSLKDVAMNHKVIPLPDWTEWTAVLMGSVALFILFQARFRDAIWVIAGGFVAFAATKYSGIYFNNAMTAFLGAIAVGSCANLVSRFTEVPGATLVVPGFIILVPGSVGFKSLTALVEHDVVRGLDTAFNMTLVGISLVAGLLISSLVTLPKASAVQELDTEL
ncbi:threonine/serine ThrE exporter family protein [Pleionea litopenaei]|uniref:Threonine/serine exporter family protein n=1 Tax=Pleionea litopenaei TaxID=3070815 RepID=A0AA51X5G9_9GAMM|nr:threonine/serine exporter family protein [Pleionea sp. HL-JVS1]WMS85928.1 threonine/serine exporter family protein [Pleionea sp. HL-JVS1]